MREIKFRAWDRKKKKVFPIHRMEFSKIDDSLNYLMGVDIHDKESGFDGDVMYGGSSAKMTGAPLQPQFELMQYTGLKDKNGKEIYEGDILLIEIRNYATDRVAVSRKYPVEYRVCKFGVNWSQSDFTGLDGFSNTSFEVIGNIYEHKQLLKDGETA